MDTELDFAAMDHSHKVMLFTIGVLHDLGEAGLLTGPATKLMTARGQMGYALLKAQGFEPSEFEMSAALRILRDQLREGQL